MNRLSLRLQELELTGLYNLIVLTLCQRGSTCFECVSCGLGLTSDTSSGKLARQVEQVVLIGDSFSNLIRVTLDGVVVRRQGKLEGLRKGVYIQNGKKVIVK